VIGVATWGEVMRIRILFLGSLIFVSLTSFGQALHSTKEELVTLSSCYPSIKYDKRLDVLRVKVGDAFTNETAPPTVEMLGERSRPNKTERAAIGVWGQLRQDCDKPLKTFFDAHSELSGIAQLWGEQSKKFYESLSALYAGDMNFGEFNKRRYDLNLESKQKASELAKADAANRLAQAELARQKDSLIELQKKERQTVLNDLLNKQAVNSRDRQRSEQCGLLDADCTARMLLGGSWQSSVESANKINAYIEVQQIRWVKGEISATEFASSIYDFHKRVRDMDSYDREEYLFYMKIARAYEAKEISLADSVYLMEKNSNQISERRVASEPPRSINFTCDSQSFGGVVTTKCR
jgi:hypothetical protein